MTGSQSVRLQVGVVLQLQVGSAEVQVALTLNCRCRQAAEEMEDAKHQLTTVRQPLTADWVVAQQVQSLVVPIQLLLRLHLNIHH